MGQTESGGVDDCWTAGILKQHLISTKQKQDMVFYPERFQGKHVAAPMQERGPYFLDMQIGTPCTPV